jgi:hypothetical protein
MIGIRKSTLDSFFIEQRWLKSMEDKPMIFELSRDYVYAWNLIQKGDRLAAWVDYEVNHKDIAQAYKWHNCTMIVAKGTQYIYLFEEQNTFNDFAKHCTKLNVEFYLPCETPNVIPIAVNGGTIKIDNFSF